MAWPAVVGAVFAGLGAISSIIGGNKASHAARRAGREEARLEGLVTAEKIRNLEVDERVMRGETRAQVAGSGVKVGEGSPLQILAEQARSFAAERKITGEVGASKAGLAITRARGVSSAARYGSYASAANQFATMFSLIPTK